MTPPLCSTMPRTVARPEAGSLAGFLGGEERLEDVLLHLRVHADAGVAHGQHHVAAGREVLLARFGLRQGQVGGFNGQRTVVRHGVPRVQRKVHDRRGRFRRGRPAPARGRVRSRSTTLIRSPTRRRSMRSKSATIRFRSSTFGCSTWRRLKASNCW